MTQITWQEEKLCNQFHVCWIAGHFTLQVWINSIWQLTLLQPVLMLFGSGFVAWSTGLFLVQHLTLYRLGSALLLVCRCLQIVVNLLGSWDLLSFEKTFKDPETYICYPIPQDNQPKLKKTKFTSFTLMLHCTKIYFIGYFSSYIFHK